MSFRTITVHSAEEVVRLLPGLKEEEREKTLLLGQRWTENAFSRAVRGANALVADFERAVMPGSSGMDFCGCAEWDCRRENAEDDRFVRSHAVSQRPRDGVRELFRTFPTRNTAIACHGPDAHARAWADAHDVPVGEVRDRCDSSTAVTGAAKDPACGRFVTGRNVEERDVVVLGGTLSALARMRRTDNVAILMVPRDDPDPARTEERLLQLDRDGCFDAVDAILVSDDVRLLVAMRRGDF